MKIKELVKVTGEARALQSYLEELRRLDEDTDRLLEVFIGKGVHVPKLVQDQKRTGEGLSLCGYRKAVYLLRLLQTRV